MIPGKEFVALGTATFVHVGVKTDDKVVNQGTFSCFPLSNRFMIFFPTGCFSQSVKIADTTNSLVKRPQDIHVSHLDFHIPSVIFAVIRKTAFTLKNTNGPSKRISERQTNCVLLWLRLRLVL